ncbi:MAG: hypothetical protein IJC86_05855 [Clostridia bacterium]|nr:hypothetical protein [Clostridia bacterium]
MIKGINRQVIEVTDTQSIYYERAWLIVRPEYTKIQQNILDKEAKKLLKDMTPPSCMKPKRSVAFWFLRLGLSAVTGACLTLLLQWLIF